MLTFLVRQKALFSIEHVYVVVVVIVVIVIGFEHLEYFLTVGDIIQVTEIVEYDSCYVPYGPKRIETNAAYTLI